MLDTDSENTTAYYGICNQGKGPVFGPGTLVLLDNWPKNNFPIMYDLWP